MLTCKWKIYITLWFREYHQRRGVRPGGKRHAEAGDEAGADV